jgi:ankyrin repeat protein
MWRSRALIISLLLIAVPLSGGLSVPARFAPGQKYANDSREPELTEALVSAAGNGNEEAVERLINAGVDLNACNKSGDTALVVAARNGRAAVVRKLLASGAGVNVRDRSGGTALPAALEKGHTVLFRQLLKAGADGYSRDVAFRTAIVAGDVDILRELVTSGVDAAAPVEGVISHVGLAVMNNRPAALKALIEFGAGVNSTLKGRDSYNPLEAAARFERVDMCKVLIDAGADARSKELALCAAASVGNTDIAKLLLAAGVNVNARGQYGKTALEHATENGHLGIVQLLLAAGAVN